MAHTLCMSENENPDIAKKSSELNLGAPPRVDPTHQVREVSGVQPGASRGSSADCNWSLRVHGGANDRGRHIEHARLLQLGKVLLLLVEREELLIKLPAMTQPSEEIGPIRELNRAS
jgi:hypothetical protein